jgi:hypothetical protein
MSRYTTIWVSVLIFFLLFSCSRRISRVSPIIVSPADADKDGIPDFQDKCPTVPGIVRYNGCSIPDSDNDGIDDDEDKCPTKAGLARNHGCPLLDTDGDGVSDEEDRCPESSGSRGNFGCPETSLPPDSTNNSIPSRDSLSGNLAKHVKNKIALSYAFKEKMEQFSNQTITVRITSDLNEEQAVVSLRKELAKRMSITKADSTIMINSLTLPPRRFYKVNAVGVDSILKIEPLSEEIQKLDTVNSNYWRFRVYALKPAKKSEIEIKVTGGENRMDFSDVDFASIPIGITVKPPGDLINKKKSKSQDENRIDPENIKKPEAFFKAYKWYLLCSFAFLLIVALIITYFRKAKATKASNKVFFSYAWGEKREILVNQLYSSLKKNGYIVVRDKVNLKYKGSITGFMEEVGKGDFVVVAICDKYFRSANCMFELYEIYRNSKMEKEEFIKKIYPIWVEPVSIDQVNIVQEYLSYWKVKQDQLEESIRINMKMNSKVQYDQFDRVKSIAEKAAILIGSLADINVLTNEELSKDNFKEIREAIEKRIEEGV